MHHLTFSTHLTALCKQFVFPSHKRVRVKCTRQADPGWQTMQNRLLWMHAKALKRRLPGNTKGVFPLMVCYGLKTVECEQRLCFFSAGTREEILLPVFMWQKDPTAMLKMIGFIVKAHFNRHNGASWIHANTFTCILHKCLVISILQIRVSSKCAHRIHCASNAYMN